MDLPFQVTICGLHELEGHCDAQATHILSILDPDWPVPDAFGRYPAHEKLELRFHDITEETPGEIAPQPADVTRLLEFGTRLDGEAHAHLLVHCHAGISRSAAALALLIAQAMPDQPAAAIFNWILEIRPQIWPNLRIIEFGDAELGRGGRLIAAAHDVYRRQLTRRPQLAEELRPYGRAREIAIGLAAP